MDAQDNLKIIHTVDGASLQNRYGKSVIQSHDIGLISLPTGEIVMADPTLRFEIADFKRQALQQKVRPGMYPVKIKAVPCKSIIHMMYKLFNSCFAIF